jgi:hypothetical protein
MKHKIKSDQIELETEGYYLGHCRLRFNILEQWNGYGWHRVPSVVDRSPAEPAELHFFP